MITEQRTTVKNKAKQLLLVKSDTTSKFPAQNKWPSIEPKIKKKGFVYEKLVINSESPSRSAKCLPCPRPFSATASAPG